MLKTALTHDVDRIAKTYQYITHSLRGLMELNLKPALNNIMNIQNWQREYWNFNRIMEIEDRFSIRSTFYFLNEPAAYNFIDYDNWIHSFGRYKVTEKRVVEVIQTLDENGWEIGVHGSFNSYRNIGLLRNEKQVLEDIIGKKVVGVRQHYLNLDGGETWRYQSELGFLYDSSWGLTRGIGFKEGRVKPFYPLKNDFTVFPLSIMDYCFMNEEEKWSRFDQICREIESEDGIMVINWHNCSFNKNDYPGWEDVFIEIIERCFDKGAIFKKLNEFIAVELDDEAKR